MLAKGIALTRVSVVVCTYSEERLDHVLACIKSLKKQTLQPIKIILALDKDKALLDFYESHMPADVKIVVSSGFGLSNARNAGVKNAEGDIVAFIDDDAIADEKWLENLVKNYEDPLVLGVGGLIKPLWESKRPCWFPEELFWIVGCSYRGLPENKAIIRNPIGCNMSFRKSVFEKAGYFSADIGRVGSKLAAHEDTEFSIRMTEKIPGHKILYDPEAVVHHRVPKSRANLKYVARRSFAEGVSKAIFSCRKSNPTRILHVEKDYLTHLLLIVIPRRLIRGYKPENISQTLALLLSTWLVLMGYLVGKISESLLSLL
jgi:glycosyltransferase involved in cell wall biosynthesis